MSSSGGIRAPRFPRPVLPRFPSSSGDYRGPENGGPRRIIEPSPIVKWDEFLGFHFDWKQGEHITLLGPTGSGKTLLALELLPFRDYVMAIATKQRDPVLYQLEQQGYVMQTSMDATTAEVHPRLILSAQLDRGSDSLRDQRDTVHEALLTVYRQGGWCVYLDELRYITDLLKLSRDVQLLWLQGRSAGISVVGGTQRPAFIPLEAYDQATHVFFWRDNDQRNLERIGGLGAHDSVAIRYEVSHLEEHQVLYINTRTGEKYRTKVEV